MHLTFCYNAGTLAAPSYRWRFLCSGDEPESAFRDGIKGWDEVPIAELQAAGVCDQCIATLKIEQQTFPAPFPDMKAIEDARAGNRELTPAEMSDIALYDALKMRLRYESYRVDSAVGLRSPRTGRKICATAGRPARCSDDAADEQPL